MRVATVESSTLTTVAYDETSELLQLGFCSGAVYEYSGVPAAVHRALLAAPSKGRYFNDVIRGRFPFRRLRAVDVVPQHAEVAARCGR